LLWFINIARSGVNMDNAAPSGGGGMPDDLQWDVDDLLKNRDAWWVPGKLANIRQRLELCWRNPESRDPGTNRIILLLDIALESLFRTKIEATDFRAMSPDDRANIIDIPPGSGVIAAGSEELGAARATGMRLSGDDCGMEMGGCRTARLGRRAATQCTTRIASFFASILRCVEPYSRRTSAKEIF
jgi:hypothetical protein